LNLDRCLVQGIRPALNLEMKSERRYVNMPPRSNYNTILFVVGEEA
jgi:hypothetical protein